jgi:hypothetical protein
VTQWWRGLAPAQAIVDCGGDRHRLRWEGGALSALDHGEVEREQTLAALGGQACACLDLIEAWERHRDDLRVLVLGSRGPTDVLVVREDPTARLAGAPSGVGQSRAVMRGGAVPRSSPRASAGLVQTISVMPRQPFGRTAYGPVGRAPRAPSRQSQKARAETELMALLGLGGGLPDRLAATVAAAWKDRLERSGRPPARSRAQLQAALHGRVYAVMRSWLGATGPECRLVMIGEKGEPKLMAEDGGVRVELPFGWLVDVWAQGLATIWGRFCLAVGTDDGRTWRLTTVGPDLGPPTVVTVELGS